MKFCVLGSGSRGNCTLVESATTTLLIDAGFSGREVGRRLAAIGRRPEALAAILVSHEHGDHIKGVGVLSRRHELPLHINRATRLAAQRQIGRIAACREFVTGEVFTVGDLRIHPFSVSHDTADPVGFVISDGRCRVGYCTDTGRVTRLIVHHLRSCQGLVLEANHDPRMLMDGPYPPALKQRVRSGQGHLANGDAADLAAQLAAGALRSLVLAHVSETNNRPELVLQAMRDRLGTRLGELSVSVAGQDEPGRLIDLSRRFGR
ncbi:MAG TPA: MBL fold metallo-hydrolase [Desulfobulbus sp.]|nr:MBL fold metallo-hydrolase [Desulfobulbus sp.]